MSLVLAELEMASDPQALKAVLEKARKARIAAIDTETVGDRFGQVRLVQIAVPHQPVLVFDVRDLPGEALAPLRELLEDRTVRKAGHNLKFDLQVLRRLLGRFEARNLFDTMLAEQLLDEGLWHPDGYSLKALAQRRLGVELGKEEQRSDWSRQLTERQIRYAARDAETVLRLVRAQAEDLVREGLGRAAEIEFGAVQPTADLEFAGLRFDLMKWEALRRRVAAEAEEWARRAQDLLAQGLENAQTDLFGGTVALNLDSSAQVLKALRGLGLNLDSTDEKVLRTKAADHPAVQALLEYRERSKALSAFLDAIPRHVREDGRVHAEFVQLNRRGVGRYSSRNPNLQQIPRGKAFRETVVPEEGKALVIADYSAIEMRIMAKLSGDRNLTRVFVEGGDPHKRTASLVMGKPEDQVTKEERQLAKSLGFGLLYGMGTAGFRTYAFTQYGVSLSFPEADRLRKKFFEAYPGIAAFHKKQDTEARRLGWIRTLSGRKRRWPDSKMPLTELANSPDQGTGADILKLALARVHPWLERWGAELVNVVHDEIVLEVPLDRAEEAKEVLSREMVAAGRSLLDPIPVAVEAEVGESWAAK